MRKLRFVLAVTAALALVGAAAWFGWSGARPKASAQQRKPQTVPVTRGDVQQSVSAPGRLEATRKVSLSFRAAGTIDSLRVRVGDKLRRGQTVATLDREPLSRGLAAARAELAASKRDLAAQIAAAKLDVASARAEFAAVPETATDAERDRLELALDKAKLQLRTLRARTADVKLAGAVRDADDALAGARLTAPFRGVVVEVKLAEGDSVQPGQAVVVLADPSSAEVRATVTEQDYPLVKIGQTAELFFEAAPDAAATGEVTRLVPERIEGDRTLFPIYIEVDELPEGVAAGMTVDASIVVAERAGVLTLPREVVHVGGSGKAVLDVWVDGRREERAVETGLRGDTTVEIVSGLREGEEVVAE